MINYRKYLFSICGFDKALFFSGINPIHMRDSLCLRVQIGFIPNNQKIGKKVLCYCFLVFTV
jgi:hypothetical protein